MNKANTVAALSENAAQMISFSNGLARLQTDLGNEFGTTRPTRGDIEEPLQLAGEQLSAINHINGVGPE